MTSTIMLNGNPLLLVQLPWERFPENQWDEQLTFANVEWNMEDAVSGPRNPYTGVIPNTFEWPGAEQFYGTCELPALTQEHARVWRAFLAQCCGILNPFLLGDPLYEGTQGSIVGAGKYPLCDTQTGTLNRPMSKLLNLRGLPDNIGRLMLAGEWVQVGYRLHMLMDDMNADAFGKAQVPVWPSLREQPADGLPLVVKDPRGLFCLATNKRTWSGDATRIQNMSVPVMEWRGSNAASI